MFLRFFHYPRKSCLFILPGSVVGIAAVDVSLPDVSYLLVNGDKWPVWGAPADIHRVLRICSNVYTAETVAHAEFVYDNIIDRLKSEQKGKP